MSGGDISQEPLNSLFKDGISEELFKLLHCKDELNFGPSVNIPDTIIYKHGQPVAWYFTAKTGRVKKKNKHNLVSASIEEAFNKHVLGYDVLGHFINIPLEDSESTEIAPSAPITIQYFDRDGLNQFLYGDKDVSGILQRFIEPKTTRNELIRAIWSPKVCLLERAANIHQLHDQRYGLYERCVIYEGPDYYYNSAPLRGPVLSGQIQKLCESIVAHISEVTYGQKQLSRIVLNFRVDSRDKIWLMYSTSIRCTDMLEYKSNQASSQGSGVERTLVNIGPIISLSNQITLNPVKSYEKIVPKNLIRCLSCTKETTEDLRHPVTYKSVIKHYDHVMHLLTADLNSANSSSANYHSAPSSPAAKTRQKGTAKEDKLLMWPPDVEIVEAAGGVGFGCLYIDDAGEVVSGQKLEHFYKQKYVRDLLIPPIIGQIHTRLNNKSYAQCRNDPLFLYKTVHVCESCYLVYAEFTTMLLKMGQDLTKLLTPDPVAVTHLSNMQQQSTASTARPSSADWRAMSVASQASGVGPGTRGYSTGGSLTGTHDGTGSYYTATGDYVSADFQPSNNHKHAKSSAIGLRSSDARQQPVIPAKVSSAMSDEQLAAVYAGGATNQGSYASGGGSSQYTERAQDMTSMIAERERHFFKEVSLNPQLKDQHPLMHLISAQNKLQLIDQQSGTLDSKASKGQESVFGSKFGKQKGDTFHKYNIYAREQPYCLGGEIILPSTLQKRAKKKSKERRLRQTASQRAFGMTGSNKDDASEAPPFTTLTAATDSDSVTEKSLRQKQQEANIKNSSKHKDYLNDALRKIEGEVEDSKPFIGKKEMAEKAEKAEKERQASQEKAEAEKEEEEEEEDQDGEEWQASNTSLTEGSTESGLMREWGITPPAPADGSVSSDKDKEKDGVSEAAKDLMNSGEPERKEGSIVAHSVAKEVVNSILFVYGRELSRPDSGASHE